MFRMSLVLTCLCASTASAGSREAGPDAWRARLEAHCKLLFASIDEKHLPRGLLEQYMEEFLDGYATEFADSPKYPNTVVVANKNNGKKTRPYVYLFEIDVSRKNRAKKVAPRKKYMTAIGEHAGTHRPTDGLDKKNKITPEGIFWVDYMCVNAGNVKKKPSNWKALGPRTISMQAPGTRSPNDDVALHGSKPNVQWTIGQRRTFGCLRLFNKDIIDLYDRLMKREPEGVGTIVIVTP